MAAQRKRKTPITSVGIYPEALARLHELSGDQPVIQTLNELILKGAPQKPVTLADLKEEIGVVSAQFGVQRKGQVEYLLPKPPKDILDSVVFYAGQDITIEDMVAAAKEGRTLDIGCGNGIVPGDDVRYGIAWALVLDPGIKRVGFWYQDDKGYWRRDQARYEAARNRLSDLFGIMVAKQIMGQIANQMLIHIGLTAANREGNDETR